MQMLHPFLMHCHCYVAHPCIFIAFDDPRANRQVSEVGGCVSLWKKNNNDYDLVIDGITIVGWPRLPATARMIHAIGTRWLPPESFYPTSYYLCTVYIKIWYNDAHNA